MKKTITSPAFKGHDIHEVWKNILKKSDSYVAIDPEFLCKAALDLVDTHSWLSYLKARYW